MKESERMVGGEGGAECAIKRWKKEKLPVRIKMEHRAHRRGSELRSKGSERKQGRT